MYQQHQPHLKPLCALVLAVGMIFGSSVNSADIEEVIVSATRSSQSISELPYPVTQMDAKSISEQMIRSLPEALAETPGVLVQKTANGQGSPFLRGFTGYRTLMLIDGIRYNNSVYRDGPSEYFSLIDISSVDQIDVIRGPASTLYGSDAIGGTLALTSRSADFDSATRHQNFLNASHRHRYSSAENSHINRTEASFGVGQRWGIHVGFSNKAFGDVDAAELGTQAKTGYDEQALDLRADILIGEHWQLTLAHQQLQQDDVWRTHSTLYAVPFEGTEAGSDLRRLKDQQRSLSYVKATGEQPLQWLDRLTLTVSEQHWEEDGDRIKSNQTQLLESFDSTMWGIDLAALTTTTNGQLHFGFDYYLDRVNSARTDYNRDGSLALRHIQGPIGDDSSFAQGGLYFQYQYDLYDRLTLTWGSRYNTINSKVGRFEDPQTQLASSYQDHWSRWVHSLRANFVSSDSGSLWGGISQSFRAPNIADVSRYGKSRSDEYEVAATNLEAETFLTTELGYKLSTTRWRLSGSLFHTSINDFITSTPTGRVVNGLTEVSKRNSAEGQVYGFELDWRYQWANDNYLFGNFTWLKGELDAFNTVESTQPERESMSRIMPATLNLGAYWQLSPNWWSRVSATYAGKADQLSAADQHDIERIPPAGTPSYTQINLHSGYHFNDHLGLTVGLENLLDESYRSHGSGSNEPGLGINVEVKVTL